MHSQFSLIIKGIFTWNVDTPRTISRNIPDFWTLWEVQNSDNSNNFVVECHPEQNHRSHTRYMSGQLEQYLSPKSSIKTWTCRLKVTQATDQKFLDFLSNLDVTLQFDIFLFSKKIFFLKNNFLKSSLFLRICLLQGCDSD